MAMTPHPAAFICSSRLRKRPSTGRCRPMPNTPSAKKYSIAEVRAFVAERTKPENRAQIKAILKGFGVSKLTELPEDKYGQLMDEVSKL